MSLSPARILAHTAWHLALLAMMLSAFAPSVGFYWQCEGRMCGVSAWVCCCVQPTADHDPDCGPTRTEAQAHYQSTSHTQETTVCAADCHCTMVVQNTEQPASRTSYFVPPSVSIVAVLPALPALEVPPLVGTIQPTESRGPPLRAVCFASPSLRAPPVT